jgi:hypothetical protein
MELLLSRLSIFGALMVESVIAKVMMGWEKQNENHLIIGVG